jgi:hypothetical protein
MSAFALKDLEFQSMIDGVIGLVVGLVGILLWVNFYASANTDSLDATTIMVLDMVPVFLGIAMLYGAIRLIVTGKSGKL